MDTTNQVGLISRSLSGWMAGKGLLSRQNALGHMDNTCISQSPAGEGDQGPYLLTWFNFNLSMDK